MAPSAPPPPLLPSLPQLIAHFLRDSGVSPSSPSPACDLQKLIRPDYMPSQYETSLTAFLEDASIADFADLPRPSVDLRDLVEEYNVDKLRSAMLLLKVTDGPKDEEEILKREVDEESLPKKVRSSGTSGGSSSPLSVKLTNIYSFAPASSRSCGPWETYTLPTSLPLHLTMYLSGKPTTLTHSRTELKLNVASHSPPPTGRSTRLQLRTCSVLLCARHNCTWT